MKALLLSHNDFVQVVGPDAKKFLQGQVSCNMDSLTAERSIRGVLCNLKGRVIADFRAIQSSNGVWLQTELGMGQGLIDVLSKYAVFSKVEISLLSPEHKIAGTFSDDQNKHLAKLLGDLPDAENAVVTREDFIAIKLPALKPRFQIISLSAKGDSLLEELLAQAAPSSKDEWERLDLEVGVIHVPAADSEQFTPQLLNYDISGVIDFKKGCYTGQEIVARMFYRSTAKKRLSLLSSPTAVEPDDMVSYSENGSSKTAEILRFSNSTAPSEAALILAILGTDAINSETPPQLSKAPEIDGISSAISDESFLQFLTLPYTE